MKRLLASGILTLAFSLTRSQDLSGVWEGSTGMAEYGKICIVRVNGNYVGYTYDEGMGHCTCHFFGEYDSVKQRLKGVNDGVIEKTAMHAQSRYNLRYMVIDGQEYLKGSVAAKSVAARFMSFGMWYPALYRRVNEPMDTTDYMADFIAKAKKVPAMAMDDSLQGATRDIVAKTEEHRELLVASTERKIDTVSVIPLRQKEIKLTIWDNGVEDGDTISVVYNSRVVVNRQAVSVRGFTLHLNVEDSASNNELILVANNLGRIPPNTAIISIEAGSQRFQLVASSDLSRNAMIIFRYDGD